MRAEVQAALHFLVGAERRLILVHPDLFEDHLLLGVEILLAQRGTEDVGQQFDRRALILGQHGRVDRPCSLRW